MTTTARERFRERFDAWWDSLGPNELLSGDKVHVAELAWQAAESTISAQAAVIEGLRGKLRGLAETWVDGGSCCLCDASCGDHEELKHAETCALSTLPSSSIERMAKEKKVVGAAQDLELCLENQEPEVCEGCFKKLWEVLAALKPTKGDPECTKRCHQTI